MPVGYQSCSRRMAAHKPLTPSRIFVSPLARSGAAARKRRRGICGGVRGKPQRGHDDLEESVSFLQSGQVVFGMIKFQFFNLVLERKHAVRYSFPCVNRIMPALLCQHILMPQPHCQCYIA